MIKKIIINNQTIDAERIKDFYQQNGKLVVICTSSQKGVKYEILEAPMKEVEFVTVPHDPEYQKQIESEIAAKFLHDLAINWNGSFTSLGSVTTFPNPKTATEMLQRDEYISRRFMPCFKNENMEPKASEEVVRKAFNEAMEEMSASMKTAGESINEGLKAIAKGNLSVNSEQLEKMIKAYGKAITRSGG